MNKDLAEFAADVVDHIETISDLIVVDKKELRYMLQCHNFSLRLLFHSQMRHKMYRHDFTVFKYINGERVNPPLRNTFFIFEESESYRDIASNIVTHFLQTIKLSGDN